MKQQIQQIQQQINFINNYQLKEEHAQLAYSISYSRRVVQEKKKKRRKMKLIFLCK